MSFEGDGIKTEIGLPAAIAANGFYLVVLNGRIAKEGAGFTFTISAGRDKVIFNTPLLGGTYKDVGIIIYQKV